MILKLLKNKILIISFQLFSLLFFFKHNCETMRTKLKLILTSISFFIIYSSCKDNPVKPKEEYIEPGRRDYVWTVDTIDGHELHLSRLWGSSPNNVWIIGWEGYEGKKIWYYNGTEWKPVCPPEINPWVIYGFNESNVLIGAGAHIWRYNGNVWKKEFTAPFEEIDGEQKYVEFDDFKGEPGNTWAVGYTATNQGKNVYGVIYHYDGSKWSKKFITKENNVSFFRIFFTEQKDKFFIFGRKHDYNSHQDYSTIFEYNVGKELKEIYSSPENHYERCEIDEVNKQLFFRMNHKIYKYKNGQFIEYIDISDLNSGVIMNGRNEKDLFLWLREGLGHYNGNDTRIIFNQENSIWIKGDVVTFDSIIFFLAIDDITGNHYFVKGELK